MASFFRRIAENWKLKTLAFALAVLLWVVVSSEQVTSAWIDVPLEVQVNDPNYQLQLSETRSVGVRFSGPRSDLFDIAVRRPPLRLVVPTVASEIATYELSPQMMQGQFAAYAVDVRPTTVQLDFARVDSRMIPVRVRVNDLLGRDWALIDSLTVDPSVVRVTGPPGRVAAVTEIFTETVGLIPEDTLFTAVVALDTTGFRGLDLSARSVTVAGTLDPVVERSITNVLIDIGEGIEVEPARVSVIVRGTRRLVQGLGPASFRVVVALDSLPAEIPAEGFRAPLRIDGMPARVQANPEPASVLLRAPEAEPDSTPAAEFPAGQDLRIQANPLNPG